MFIIKPGLNYSFIVSKSCGLTLEFVCQSSRVAGGAGVSSVHMRYTGAGNPHRSTPTHPYLDRWLFKNIDRLDIFEYYNCKPAHLLVFRSKYILKIGIDLYNLRIIRIDIFDSDLVWRIHLIIILG